MQKQETQNKKISVVIPVYNVEDFLARSMDSVINQTYKNLEIICVNDGSTDNSLNILTSYANKDSRIKIINKQNSGLSDVRNIGIEIASGEYISFIDSDDYIEEDFFEKLMESIQESGADVAMTATKCFENGKIKCILKPYFTKCCDSITSKIRILRGGGVWDKLYSLSLIKDNDIRFPSGKNYEGNIFLLKIAFYANKIYFSPNTFYNYCQRSNSICTNKKNVSKNMQDRCYILKEMCKFILDNKFTYKEKFYAHKYILRSVCDKNDIYITNMPLILKNINFLAIITHLGLKFPKYCVKFIQYKLKIN